MIIPLLLGLFSSLHCVGMCGPIVLALPVHNLTIEQRTLRIIAYHLGRIGMYALLGALFGTVGKGLFIAGFQQNISILLGVLLILFVLFFKERYLQNTLIFNSKWYFKFKSLFNIVIKKRTLGSFVVLGLLNGLLPCAMIYTTLFGATATQGTLHGALFMFWYGLGTIPLLTVIAWVGQWATATHKKTFKKLTSVFLVLTGILLIIRGSGIGIPYIAPSTLQLFISGNPQCF